MRAEGVEKSTRKNVKQAVDRKKKDVDLKRRKGREGRSGIDGQIGTLSIKLFGEVFLWQEQGGPKAPSVLCELGSRKYWYLAAEQAKLRQERQRP